MLRGAPSRLLQCHPSKGVEGRRGEEEGNGIIMPGRREARRTSASPNCWAPRKSTSSRGIDREQQHADFTRCQSTYDGRRQCTVIRPVYSINRMMWLFGYLLHVARRSSVDRPRVTGHIWSDHAQTLLFRESPSVGVVSTKKVPVRSLHL